MGVARYSDGREVDYDQATGQFLVEGHAVVMASLIEYERAGSLTWASDETRAWAYQHFAPQEQVAPEPAAPVAATQVAAEPAPAGAPQPSAPAEKKKFPVWAIILIVVLALLLVCGCASVFGAASLISKVAESAVQGTVPDAGQLTPSDPSGGQEPDTGSGAEPLSGDPTLTQYDQIENGMNYDDVAEVMGSQGEQVSSVEIGGQMTEVYQWASDDDTSNVIVTLQDGRVIGKMQYGLD